MGRRSIEETKRLKRISDQKHNKPKGPWVKWAIRGGLALIGLFLLYFFIFVFEFPAQKIDNYAVEKMVISDYAVSVDISTNAYDNKLVPLRFITDIAGGETIYTSDKEVQIALNDGRTLTLHPGSRKIAVDGQEKKYGAPTVSYENSFLVSGELLEDVFPGQGSFAEGVGTYRMKDGEPNGYTTFDDTQGYMRLVNKDHIISETYTPTDLVDINTYGTIVGYGPNTTLRQAAADAVSNMYADSGLNFVFTSGFRTFDSQKELYQQEIENEMATGLERAEAEAQAATKVAVPGTSEHQTGLAVDFAYVGQVLNENFKNTPAGIWLRDNCYRYGFIVRFPDEKQTMTNIIYEPWHYRYIGYPHSEILSKSGQVMEEYYGDLHAKRSMNYAADDGRTYLIWYFEEHEKPKVIEYNGDGGADVAADNDLGVIITIPLN